jgi:hypothetical protein
LERLAGAAGAGAAEAPPPQEWRVADPAELPLRLRRWRAGAPEGARLLIRLDDARPAELQERLWGPALRLGADLLAERPGLRWSISARAPALETLAAEHREAPR